MESARDSLAVPPEPPSTSAGAVLGEQRLGYVASLDGLRAVAVVLVFAFHSTWNGRPVVDGGFLGVDAFFVLSGFLITTLLLQERLASGRLSLGRFYARRAHRLLPIVVVVVAIVALAEAVWSPAWTGGVEPLAYAGALFYFMNWLQVGGEVATGPLAHLWSLSIEEQFYLLWPLVLVVLTRRRVDRRALLAVALGGAVASAAWRSYLWLTNVETQRSFVDAYFELTFRPPVLMAGGGAGAAWNRVYFGSDTRADALLIGAVLAVVLVCWGTSLLARTLATARIVGWLALAAIVGIVLRADVVDRTMPTFGMPAFALSAAALVATLVLVPGHPISRALASPPLVWIGKRSYGIYVLHIPVIAIVADSALADRLGPGWIIAVQAVLTGAAAALSYRFLEQPILARARRFRT